MSSLNFGPTEIPATPPCDIKPARINSMRISGKQKILPIKDIHCPPPKGRIEPKETTFVETVGTVLVREFKGIEKCRKAPIINGLPSHGLTSIIAANFLAEQLDLELIGVITSIDFPMRCVVVDGQPSHAVRFLGNEHLIVLLCEFELKLEFTSHILTALINFVKRNECRYLITLEGLPVPATPLLVKLSEDTRVQEPRKLHFLTTDEEMRDILTKYGAQPITQGIIDGATGGILARSRYSGIPILAILAEVEPYDPGAKSAAAFVKALDEILDVYIDTEPLYTKALELEEKTRNLIKEEESGKSKRTASTDAMYI